LGAELTGASIEWIIGKPLVESGFLHVGFDARFLRGPTILESETRTNDPEGLEWGFLPR